MAFHLTVAGSLEPLAERLAGVLSDPLDDPFTPEIVAVPGGGVKAWLVAWLARRLGATNGAGEHRQPLDAALEGAGGDGIVANVEMVFPATIVARALGEERGLGRWATGPLTWTLHEVLQDLGPELGQATDAVRARAIADLFDRYTLYRPEMVQQWSDGRDVDGAVQPLEGHQRWQPRLWRAVQEHLGGPSDAQLLLQGVAALEAGEVPDDVPRRVSLIGLASLPGPHLRVLTALARHRDVNVLAPVASAERWRRVVEELQGQPPLALPVERGDPAAPVGGGHPLVTGWGRASREANLLLFEAARDSPWATLVEAPAAAEALAPEPSLLVRLQHGLRADEAPPGPVAPGEAERRALFDPVTDPSVRWHRAHGPARQVEALRDTLLHLFEELDDDGRPRFQPRDVAVLCPDVPRVAALVEATFAGDDRHGVPAIGVRVADRSMRQDNVILDAAAALLDLLDGRFRASAVVAFAARPPVRERFGFDASSLSRMSEWVEATNIRWGLGPPDQARFGLPAALDAHTFLAGVDQLLLGATMAPSGARLGPGAVAPFATIEGDDVAVAGGLAEMVHQLDRAMAALRAGTTVDAWCDALLGALRALCAVPDADGGQWRTVERMVEELREEAAVDGVPRTTPVDPADVAVLVRGRLSAAGGRARFGTGAVTVSSLTAQRAVPHRVVCVLGLDQDAVAGGLAAEDLVAARPCVGDGDPRSEQRAELLDAVLAAEERLVLFSSGHDVRTNAELPPVVALAELFDVVDATVRMAGSEQRPRDALTIHHPRHAWAEAALCPGGLGDAAGSGPWSFDEGALRAAVARRDQQRGTTALLGEPLDPIPVADGNGVEEVALDQLLAAISNPARVLLGDRLGWTLPGEDDERDDAIPLAVKGLEQWQVIDRLLRLHLTTDHAELEDAVAAWEMVERRRGAVPPLRFGDHTLGEARRRVDAFEVALAEVLGEVPHDPHPVAVDIGLSTTSGQPIRVQGFVPGVCGNLVLTVTASSFKPKDHLTAWLRIAALTLEQPDRPWEAVILARDGSATDKATVKVVRVQLTDPARAAEVLALADDLRRRALTDVVPAFPATTHARWCKGMASARAEWDNMFGDSNDRWIAAAFGTDFDELLSLPPRPGEDAGPGPGPGARLTFWAERIWGTFEDTTGVRLRQVPESEAVSTQSGATKAALR